ncbi:MAG: sigma-70 family RNA polymerase sigma factor [Christensenellales bacterium]
MENKNKEYYLFINGEKVIVTEEVYRAYIRPVRAEQRARRREKKCCVLGEKGNLVRCTRDCETCEYAAAGKKPSGSFLSLDGLMDAGFDVADPNTDIESELAEREEKQEVKEKVQAAIAQLKPKHQEIVRMIYFEEKTQKEVGAILGIAKSTMSEMMARIKEELKNILGNL